VTQREPIEDITYSIGRDNEIWLILDTRPIRLAAERRGVNPGGWGSRPPRFWAGGRQILLYLIMYTGSMFESSNFWREI